MATLAALLDKPDVLHDTDTMRRLIEAAAGAGAVDGFTVRNTLTDDGVPYVQSIGLINQLHWLIKTKTYQEPELEALRVETDWYRK